MSVLVVARVAMSAARALAGVVVPIYLTLIGWSGVELGELFLVAALAAALLSSGSGLVSDRLGRRPFVVVLPLLAAGASAVFASTRATPALFMAAALGTFGRGAGAGAGAVGPYQPVESALVAESIGPEQRNAAFGRLASASSLGALVGGLLATLAGKGQAVSAAAVPGAFRLTFVFAALLALVAGLLGLLVVEPARPTLGRRARPRLPRRSLPLLARLWVTNGVNGLAIGMFGPFVTYWFFRRYGAGPATIGVLYAVINAVTIATTLSAAPLAKRHGLVRTVVAVRVVQAVLLVPMVLAPWFVLAAAIYLVRMAVQRVGLPLRQSYVLAMADPDERASVTALSNLPSQAAMAGAPVASGYVFDEVSLSLPFELAAVFQALNAVLFWVFFHAMPPVEETEPVLGSEEELGGLALEGPVEGTDGGRTSGLETAARPQGDLGGVAEVAARFAAVPSEGGVPSGGHRSPGSGRACPKHPCPKRP